MPIVDVTAHESIHRLLCTAAGDTGQPRTVAAFLLAWWNAESCGGFHPADLWAVGAAMAHGALAMASLVAQLRLAPFRTDNA